VQNQESLDSDIKEKERQQVATGIQKSSSWFTELTDWLCAGAGGHSQVQPPAASPKLLSALKETDTQTVYYSKRDKQNALGCRMGVFYSCN
jgi:hypothetical protein